MLCVALDLGTLCSDIDVDWQAGRLAGLHVVTDRHSYRQVMADESKFFELEGRRGEMT